MGERRRLRIVSPERMRRVAEELSKVSPLAGVKLSPDGSATILTLNGSLRLDPDDRDGEALDRLIAE